MADQKISVLPEAALPLVGDESVPVVQGGVTVRVPSSALKGLKGDKGDPGDQGLPGEPGADGADGRGIASIVRTSGTGAPGTTDTYTITFTDATTATFTVYNGADGSGDFVPLAGNVTMTGPLSVPSGASGAQVPQAQEIGTLANAQLTTHYKRSNILGAVSQSGGVPTGAVIERGSNANGSYVRFADGTQICITAVSSGVTGTATGSVYQSAGSTKSWPATFAATPEASVSVRGSAIANCWPGDYAASSTGITELRAFSPVSTASCVLAVVAIGRWF